MAAACSCSRAGQQLPGLCEPAAEGGDPCPSLGTGDSAAGAVCARLAAGDRDRTEPGTAEPEEIAQPAGEQGSRDSAAGTRLCPECTGEAQEAPSTRWAWKDYPNMC